MRLYLIAFLSGLLLLIVGLWISHHMGYKGGYEFRDLECTKEKKEVSDKLYEAERQAQAVKDKGRIIADRLANELAESKAQVSTLQRSLSDEIRARASASRRCIDSQLTGMLNQLSPIRESSGTVDQARPTSTRVDAQATPTPTDSGGSSARAVAVALSEARGGYEVCRTQLHKLIDVVKEMTQ